MHCLVLLKESVRSGTIASLAMMPFGFLFKLLDLRVGYYGPKLAALVFDEPTRFVLFADPTPWQLEFNVVYPSLLVHLVFGVSIGLTARRFVDDERNQS